MRDVDPRRLCNDDVFVIADYTPDKPAFDDDPYEAHFRLIVKQQVSLYFGIPLLAVQIDWPFATVEAANPNANIFAGFCADPCTTAPNIRRAILDLRNCQTMIPGADYVAAFQPPPPSSPQKAHE